RLRNPRYLARYPSRDLLPSRGHRQRPREHSRICRKSQEACQNRPRHPDGDRTSQLAVKPLARGGGLGSRGVYGREEDVNVDQDHLNPSPSAWARASATLSMLTRKGPRSNAWVRNGSRFFGFAVMSRKPRRRASLTRSLRLAFRARRRRSN